MADTKVSALTELAEAPASGDLIPVIDVSDTTMAASGTTKKVTRTNLLSGAYQAGGTDVAVADGGTGASDAATARTNLGLGSIATQAASNVSVTGGSVTGITDLAVADGGTGASTASGARTNLGLAIGTDVVAPNQDTTGKSAKTDALNSATTVVNVSSATAPSAGQVLTATSSTAATWQAASSGAPTARYTMTERGFLSTQFTHQVTGTGAAMNQSVYGLSLEKGTTTTGGASIRDDRFTGINATPFSSNPQFWVGFQVWQISASQTWSAYFTLGNAGLSNSSPYPLVTKYMGFKVVGASSAVTVYAVHRDGTNAEVATLCSGIDPNNTNHQYMAVMTSGTDIKFYVDKVLKATHTTNLPTGGFSSGYPWVASIKATAGTTNDQVVLENVGYSWEAV